MKYKINYLCVKRDGYSGFLRGEIYSISPAEGFEGVAVLVSGKLVTSINGKTSRSTGVVIPTNVIEDYFSLGRKKYESLHFT